MKVEVAVLGFRSLIFHMISVDVKQHLKKKKNWIVLDWFVVQYDLQVGHTYIKNKTEMSPSQG